MKKIYYQIQMTATSPLRIGGGYSDQSDCDILLDGRGVPFIPGSSIAGVLRDKLPKEDDKKRLFGDVEISTGKSTASKILVNDGITESVNPYISVRHGVGLDEWGTTIKGAKYDFQIAEVVEPFLSVLECDFDNQEDIVLMDKLLSDIAKNGLMVGARTRRGYGHLDCVIKRKIFEFPTEIDEWLEFNSFDKEAFDSAEDFNPIEVDDNTINIEILFNLDGNFITSVKEANAVVREDGTNPDNVTLKNIDGKPVIPGTVWAGAFRHHMISIIKDVPGIAISEKEINRMFGKGDNPSDSTRSLILFNESVIEGGEPIVTIRNSIDRFTAAPTNGHLFVNESWHGGSSILSMRIEKGKVNKELLNILSVAIMDLSNGLLPIGGGAGIGKGTIKITSIKLNGLEKLDDLNNYVFNIEEGK